MLNDECSILLIDDDVDVLDAYTQMLETGRLPRAWLLPILSRPKSGLKSGLGGDRFERCVYAGVFRYRSDDA
ncbi:hypothetical protein LFZ31_27195, partial [Salmonella enterica subsp. enterica serovar Newport str. S09097]